MGGIETRLLFALAAWVSAMLHVLLYLGLDFGAPAALQEVRVEVRIQEVPESSFPSALEVAQKIETAPSHENESSSDEKKEESFAADGTRWSPADETSAHVRSTTKSQSSWRRRLREKEAKHETRMAETSAKLGVLAGSDATFRLRPSTSPSPMLFRCGTESTHRRVTARGERDVSRYISIFPAGLFPARYVEQMRELLGASGRGKWRFALPQGSLPIVLDAPRGFLLAAGRDDRRCVVDVDFTPRTFFPLRFLHIPLRIVDAHDRVHSVVVDVHLFDDGTFRLFRVDGDALPFSDGALYDHATVGRNLRKHYVGARLLRNMAGILFGEEP